jgi:hypothetical protein
MRRPRRRVRVRSGAFVGRARRAAARLPPRPAPDPAGGRGPAAAPGDAGPRDRGRRGGRAGRRCSRGVSAGSTNTGAIDPLGELASVCREHGVWLHVDAAYGGFTALTERGREALRGIEAADSIALDPHKWLYQPVECGCLLVREGHLLRRAFEVTPDYLRDAAVTEGEVNFSDLGLQLTRGWRALKVWLSIQTFGLDAFRQAIDNALDLAVLAERACARRPRSSCSRRPARDRLLPAPLRRRRGRGAALNAALVSGSPRTGEALVSSTRLHGVYAIRLCALNHTSRPEDVEWVLDWFARAEPPEPRPRATPAERAPPSPMPAGPFAVAEVLALPLFAGCSEQSRERVADTARELTAAPGEDVIRAISSSATST